MLQGVQMDEGSFALFSSLFNFPSFPCMRLHLFSSDDTPTVSDQCGANPFTEVTRAGYNALNLTVSPGNFQRESDGIHCVFGSSSFSFHAGPAETVYGWFLGDEAGSIDVFVWGGRLETPFPIPLTGGSLTLDVIDLLLHDCGYPPPAGAPAAFQNGNFTRPFLGTGNMTYTPAWPAGTWTGGALTSSQSAIAGPNPLEFAGQACFLQGTPTISQTVTAEATGTYEISLAAGQRGFADPQTVAVHVDGLQIDTFGGTAGQWNLYTSPTFSLSAGAHTIAFAGLNGPPADATMFITEAELRKA